MTKDTGTSPNDSARQPAGAQSLGQPPTQPAERVATYDQVPLTHDPYAARVALPCVP